MTPTTAGAGPIRARLLALCGASSASRGEQRWVLRGVVRVVDEVRFARTVSVMKLACPWLRLPRRRTRARGRDVLVLSGGGPRGAAQVGMLAELLEAGVEPAALIGCSVGSLNAAWFACNPTQEGVAALEELWLSMRSDDLFPVSRLGLLAAFVRRDHICAPDGLRRLIQKIPVRDLNETKLPLRVVTTHLETGRLVVHAEGPVSDILAASCTIPGVFPPVALGDGLHVDGGVVGPAPVHLAQEFAPRRVFLLDASGPGGLSSNKTALDVIRSALSHATRSHVAASRRLEGVIAISCPDAVYEGMDARDFSRTAELIEQGRIAARAVLAAHGVSR